MTDRSLAGELFARVHWHANRFLTRRLWLVERLGLPLTVEDAFGTPGDTLLTAIVCREIQRCHPALKINCVTPNPELLLHDPHIATLNRPATFCRVLSSYPDLIEQKDGKTNILKPTFDRLGISGFDYRCRVYLLEEEKTAAAALLRNISRPLITINTASREKVKMWPVEKWRELIPQLARIGSVVQLGDASEPEFESVHRFAGKLSMRQSMAVLAHSNLHIGPVSFLMHAANGLDVPAVIIYGGRETPANSGYAENENLYAAIECSPCWIHDSRGQICPRQIECMGRITPRDIMAAVEKQLPPGQPPLP